MAVATLSEALDNLYVTTWRKMHKETVDAIFDKVAFWFFLRDRGGFKSRSGGSAYEHRIEYAESGNPATFVGKGASVTASDTEFATAAIYEKGHLVKSLIRFWIDDQNNRGEAKIIDFARMKLDNAKTALTEDIEEALFKASPGALEWESLRTLISDTPSTGTTGGIARSNTWWRNQQESMTGQSFNTSGYDFMRRMYNNCSRNFQANRPNLIMTDQKGYERYENTFDNRAYSNSHTALQDAGFENILFKGIPVVWSAQAPTERMYFINTNSLFFEYDSSAMMRMTSFKPIPQQIEDRVAHIITSGNLVCKNLREQGVITGIDKD